MELTVRAATIAELPELMQLYTNARAFMQTHGNPTQWHAGYPGEPAWPLKSSEASAMW